MTLLSCKPDDASKEMLDSQFELYESVYDWYYRNSVEYYLDENTGNLKSRDNDSKNNMFKMFRLKHDLEDGYEFIYQNINIGELADKKAMVNSDRAAILITTILRKPNDSGLLRIEEVYYHHVRGFHYYGTPIPMPIETVYYDSDIAFDSEFKAFWNNDFEDIYRILREDNKKDN